MAAGVLALALGLAATGGAQDWSGASLRGALTLQLPPGARLEVVATGLRLPQDLAVEPPDAVWVLTQADPAGGAGALRRVPLQAGPVDLARLPTVSLPYSPHPARFRTGSVARDPATGDLYVGERLGQHLLRVRPGREVVLYARGATLLADSRGLAFDRSGRLLVLDRVGRPAVAEDGAPGPLEAAEEAERYEGPLIHALRVDEPLPLPRQLAYAPALFPPAALQRRGASLPPYAALLPLPSGEVILSAPNGTIDRLRPDGSLARVARVYAARAVAAGAHGELYAVDFLGDRVVRIHPEGTVERFVEGLARPAALAVLPDRSLVIAEDSGRLLRLRLEAAAPR